ncbi:hypothetical protein AURDEDRAFT_127070 [Auricularia subglabra TFB-10046 SS5]|nr:hypothetical protein AURDEDRAFT_127070 [Auricularia subglabra TFB-10046 SS5]
MSAQDMDESPPGAETAAEPVPATSLESGTLMHSWAGWPENDPRFDPIFDNTDPIREGFCMCRQRPYCQFCHETSEVFHVSKYTASGRCVIDRKITGLEVPSYLRKVEDLDVPGEKTTVRLLPPTRHQAQPTLHFRGSQAYCCFTLIPRSTVLRHTEYFSREFYPVLLNASRTSTFSTVCPNLYLRYNERTRETVAYVSGSAAGFVLLRQIYASRAFEANQDPFLIVAAFLQQRIGDIQINARHVRYFLKETVRRMLADYRSLAVFTFDDASGSDPFVQFSFDAVYFARLRSEIAGMFRAIAAIKAEHQRFVQRGHTNRFQMQLALLSELQSAFIELEDGVRFIREMSKLHKLTRFGQVLGHAQVLNGVDMAKIARDNQKQAQATEDLARAARRDGEIMKRDSATMKTITVVTLIYLPATMGIFDFGVESGEDGRIRIAREGWIFLAISLPLTALTLGLAFLWKQTKERQWKNEDEKAKKQSSGLPLAAEKTPEGDESPQAVATQRPTESTSHASYDSLHPCTAQQLLNHDSTGTPALPEDIAAIINYGRASPAEGPSPSLLDDWEYWPENDPKFDPAFDNAWPLRDEFCKCTQKQYCGYRYCNAKREILHITECTTGGENRKVNREELREHLAELELFDKSDAKATDHPAVRLLRRDYDVLPVFQSAYEGSSSADNASKPQPGTLHIFLQCLSYVADPDVLRNSEYYSDSFGGKLREGGEGGYGPMAPSLYLRYDESSRESIVYVSDSTMTFHAVRGTFLSSARGADQDPFLCVAIYLQQRVTEIQKFFGAKQITMDLAVKQARTMSSLDQDSTAFFDRFDHLAVEAPSITRMGHEASNLLRAIRAAEAEHRLFIQRTGRGGDAVHAIRRRFQLQAVRAIELTSACSGLVSGLEIVKDMLVGRAQIANGIDMSKMAKDNRKQAKATEELARDARRDSEIMKTITVVTLVYLPATFVSLKEPAQTLLSMGIFDFGLANGDNAQIRIAREGWVFLAIAFPLTLLTLGLAYIWARSKERQWMREVDAAQAEEAKEEAARAAAVAKAQADAAPEVENMATGDGAAATGDGEKQVGTAAPEPAGPMPFKNRVLARFHLRRRRASTELEEGNASTPLDSPKHVQ